jgi:hypothetical protein
MAAGTRTAMHVSHDVHADHHHGKAHADEPAAPAVPCPHCPLESGAANTGHADCVTADAQEDGGTAPAKVASTPVPPVFLASWLLPATRASPPSIGPPLAHALLPVNAVTLNIRHCVLLI